MLAIDGSLGEGGGQVLRTCLSLAAITQRPFQLYNIRAKRKKSGLRPQHLTAVRATAAICQATISGDKLNSHFLEFRPQTPPLGGRYRFDVADAARGGSAGSVMLILQAVLWPLLFADQPSHLTLKGGTHVPFSPPYHYMAEVARPAFARLGADFVLDLVEWGWYPVGGGEVTAVINPITQLAAAVFEPAPSTTIDGVAAVTNLPAHIPQRMARRAINLLAAAGYQPNIAPIRERGNGAGAGIFLWQAQAGFSSVGRRGLPADKVAETAVAYFLAFAGQGASVDEHLADQLLLPMALGNGRSAFTTPRLTQHTLTHAALIQQWLDTTIIINGDLDHPAEIAVEGTAFHT